MSSWRKAQNDYASVNDEFGRIRTSCYSIEAPALASAPRLDAKRSLNGIAPNILAIDERDSSSALTVKCLVGIKCVIQQ